MLQEAKTLTERAWKDRKLLNNSDTKDAIYKVIELLDKGNVRVAEPSCAGEWLVNEWIKKAVILYPFTLQENHSNLSYDKIPFKNGDYASNVVVKYGSYIDKKVTLMPSYINIGAHIESGSLIDSWVTVNSCAQIGKNVHLSENVVIGGVLEPPQSSPVIVENGCFIGANCSLLGGVYIQEESIIAPNVIISNSTKIIDITDNKNNKEEGVIPPRSVVIAGNYPRKFPNGTFQVPCALIIGKRKESDNLKLSLNEAIKKFKLGI